jgi:hypothetical protein
MWELFLIGLILSINKTLDRMIEKMEKDKKPNPGSVKAEELGCTCLVIDNHYGKGFKLTKSQKINSFIISNDCPIHGGEIKPFKCSLEDF